MRTIDIDPWRLVERGFDPHDERAVLGSESLFSLGNGAFGGRANFEETFSGRTLWGHYIGGVYYPDKTRVGWWKNGYPDSFAKVLNSAFWIGMRVWVDGRELDLAKVVVSDFRRELDMRMGVLRREFTAEFADGVRVAIEVERLISMAEAKLGALSFKVTLLSAGSVELVMEPYIEGGVRNEDANYDETFWEAVEIEPIEQAITMRTRKTGFEVCWAQRTAVSALENVKFQLENKQERPKNPRIGERYVVQLAQGQYFTCYKYVGIVSSLNGARGELRQEAVWVAERAKEAGFEQVKQDHVAAWARKWAGCDVVIHGDPAAQQGIRFCIFQLLQTYTGTDSRLNVGPKGFTGEKYGGGTYWDTEAYCLPFYLCTSGEEVAEQLLRYRYEQLPQAIENADKLGFTGGAALYPMVTMTGRECHNEWEITFEEIHRNGAIAYAIYNYCRYTGSEDYLDRGGREALVAIARFWAQRASWSQPKQQYVILGVTGPNEYENNVDNNWYTNYMARWCLRYAADKADGFAEVDAAEIAHWRAVADGLYLPQAEYDGAVIALQQAGYLDKEQRLASELAADERPLNQHWSWDRILRSCFIKQADVLQGIYFFQDDFDPESIARHFDFYEPRTVHESSLSPCVHAILAAKIGRVDKAYELYLRAARLDLDDYNREVHEGLHITSMAGAWLSVVEGFGGVRVDKSGELRVEPRLPDGWDGLEFKLRFRGELRHIRIERGRGYTVTSEKLP